MLTQNDMFNISYETIREYKKSDESVPVIICGKVFKKMNSFITASNRMIDTQEIYNDIAECFSYYNHFVLEKRIEAPLIDDIYYEWLAEAINMGLELIINE